MIRMQDMVFAVYRTEGRREELRENDITWEIGRIQQEWFVSEKSANTNGRLPHLCSLSLLTQRQATPQNTKKCAHVT
jgi:hypothetical protein